MSDSSPREPTRSARRPGMKEVADRAGVAVSSVSRVLSGHRDVSELMRNRVLDAVAALGYEPDILAQSMRTGATMTVAFIVNNISNPVISEMVLGAETVFRGGGYSMIVANSMNDPAVEREHISLMERRRVDGMLLSLADETFPQLPETIDRLSIPAVLVDRHLKGSTEVRTVTSDHQAGMLSALERLHSLGHRSIALINGSLALSPSRERATTLRRFAKVHPDVQCVIRSSAFTAEFGMSAMRELMSKRDRPSAIIAGGNQILVGLLRGLHEFGLEVPRDVSIVACDDSPLAELMSPPLDTIRRDVNHLGSEAARSLLALLRGEQTASIVLPTSFEQRSSSARPTENSELLSTV